MAMTNKKYTPEEDEPLSLDYSMNEDEEREVCEKCFGTGENLDPGTKCRKCSGTGYPKQPKNFS